MIHIEVDTRQPGQAFGPFWRRCLCAGRAAEGLRADWQAQLREVQREIGFDYLRFHGLFHEDMFVYHEEKDGTPCYNWQYVDALFDFLLSIGIRPFVELGFMPPDMASGSGTVFWWRGNATPPKDYDKWATLCGELARHCLNRYGLSEVGQWYFEVWNEPDLRDGFWYGTQEEYFKLYACTARALKAIDPTLRIGGPATSASHAVAPPWVADLIAFCAREGLPLDFVSTHPYPNNWPMDGYGNCRMTYRDEHSTLDDLRMARKIVDASPFPGAEIHLTEWNSSPSPRDLVHDTAFMAPFIIKNNLECLGLVDSLGFWTFSDVFEEGGAGNGIFHGGFGLINLQGLKKPAYYGYWFLSRLGTEVLAQGDGYFVARKEETLQILMWNYCHYGESFADGDFSGLEMHRRYGIFKEQGDLAFDITIRNPVNRYKKTEYILGRDKGSVYDAWLRNGAPDYPDAGDLDLLRKMAGPTGGLSYVDAMDPLTMSLSVPPHGVHLVELRNVY